MQMKPNNNALDLLRKKYFRPGENDWPDLCKRVAKGIAKAEATPELRKEYTDRFYNMIVNLEFIPSTPCLLNADTTGKGQLSSCFIISLQDNIESIYKAKGECAKIFQKNGGVGFNISVLRPTRSTVETSGGYSCGTIGFMEEFNLTADVVTRNNIRKGAIKIDLNDWHPDIYQFVHAKDDITKLTFMNISVSLSDKFMDAVKTDADWELKFPDYSQCKEVYDAEWNGDMDSWEAKGYPVKVYQVVKARALYREIMESAWKTGEPGVSFRDAMDRQNPNPHLGKVHSTNPCSEFASIPYNSCNLGSINLLMCVNDDGTFNWTKFHKLVADSVRFLDNMITANKLPLASIDHITKNVRSVGLGVMGFAHAMYKLGIAYNSAEAHEFSNRLFGDMYNKAMATSIALAEEKGVYPFWEGSIWQQQGIKIRNSNFLSIAPTGSISFIAGTSGGIEPVFALVYSRKTNDGDIYYIVDPVFQDALIKRGLYSEKLLSKISDNHGSCQGVDEVPEDMQKIFVTSHDITPREHTEIVGIIQKNVDLSISKTVNLPYSATVEDVMNVYIQAHRAGTKGITVYRDGSRDGQTLAVKRDTPAQQAMELMRGDWKPIAEDTYYEKAKIHIGCGKITLFIGWSESENCIQELWMKRSGQGGCSRNLENLVIAMSGMLRLGGNITNIERAFEGVDGCNSFTRARERGNEVSKGNNCGNAILYAVKKFLADMEKEQKQEKELVKKAEQAVALVANIEKITVTPEDVTSKNKCPECGEPIDHEGGCTICRACGFSKCN